MATITAACLQGISRVLADEDNGLTERDLEEILRVCGIPIEFSEEDATRSLFGALQRKQFEDGNRRAILAFLRVAMDPTRYETEPGKFSTLRQELNEQFVSCNLEVGEDGELKAAVSGSIRGKIPVWENLILAYASSFRNFGLVIRLSWAAWLTAYVLAIVFTESVRLQITEFIGLPKDSVLELMVLGYARILPFIFLGSIFAVAWHRFVLLDERRTGKWLFFRFGNRELLYICAALIFFSINFLLQFVVFGIIEYIIYVMPMLHILLEFPWVFIAGKVLLFTNWIIVCLIFGRILLVLPETAIDQSLSLRHSWKLTRGNTWRIAAGLALITIPFLTFFGALGSLNTFLGDTGGLVVVPLSYVAGVFALATVAGYASLTYQSATREKNPAEKMATA